jgi:hypothetical protein
MIGNAFPSVSTTVGSKTEHHHLRPIDPELATNDDRRSHSNKLRRNQCGHPEGAMPTKVSESERAMVTAGFRKYGNVARIAARK